MEKAAKSLHRMSPCTPVSVPAKITWLTQLKDILFASNEKKRKIKYATFIDDYLEGGMKDVSISTKLEIHLDKKTYLMIFTLANRYHENILKD